MSTGTHFITGLVSLDFCEEYLKDKIIFLKKLGKDYKLSVQQLKVPKSSFFHCEEYNYAVKNHVTRARWLR